MRSLRAVATVSLIMLTAVMLFAKQRGRTESNSQLARGS